MILWILVNIICLQAGAVLGGRLAVFFHGRFRERGDTQQFTYAARLPWRYFATWMFWPNEIKAQWNPAFSPQTLTKGRFIYGLMPACFLLCVLGNGGQMSWTTSSIAMLVGLIHVNNQQDIV